MIKIVNLLLSVVLCMASVGARAQEAQSGAEALLAQMSISEKVAQLFLVRCPSQGAVTLIEENQPGGYLLFADDFEGKTPEQMKERLQSYQAASNIPMLIGVDEEGGTVTRVSRFKAFRAAKFQSPRALYEAGGMSLIVEDAKEKSALLLALGVNFNLAPVSDVTTERGDFMYARALGQDAEATALYTAAVVKAMNNAGIASALKHFPGYGSNGDTHTGMVRDERSFESFVARDFLPFQAGIAAGAGCILVSHNITEAMDPEAPASLSPAVHRVLRGTLGFEGVIMTDDLAMKAIRNHIGIDEAAVLAVEAGNDLLCSSNFAAQHQAVLDAVQSGRISEARIDESVLQILRWKEKLGII